MSDDLDQKMRKIFSELFRVDGASLSDDTRRGELEGWDSLGHLDLVSELENQFSVRIDEDRALEIETFGEAKAAISELLADAAG